MKLHTSTTVHWMIAIGILLFAVALLASSCASFESADVHGESYSHGVAVACHNLGSVMGSRISLPLIVLLVLLLGFTVVGSVVRRIEVGGPLRISSPADFSQTSITDYLQRAFQEGILHSRAYIAAFVSYG